MLKKQLFEASKMDALKVNLFIALSPVTYLTHQSSLLLSAAKRFHLGDLWHYWYPYDFLTWSELPTLANWLCKVTFGLICEADARHF